MGNESSKTACCWRFVGDSGLTVLATDLVVDVSIHHGVHEALSINCTLGLKFLEEMHVVLIVLWPKQNHQPL